MNCPGGAGRNRTLGIEKLAKIEIPLPPLTVQQQVVELQAKVDAVKALQAETAAELNALLPTILDRAIRVEL